MATEWFQQATTSTPLAGNATYTSSVCASWPHSGLVVACLTDADGTLFVDFSPNGTNWDSTLTFNLSANLNEVHRVTITRPYFRIRVVNGSAAQSFMRLTTMADSYMLLSSAMNSPIQQDADSINARVITEETSIAEGKLLGYNMVQRFGNNADVDTATVPEDVWEGGGVFTGFPTGAPEELEVFSSSASDTGVLNILYLASNTSTAYTSANVTLNGTTPVNTGITAYRVHFATFVSGASTTFNVGTITVRHRTTTANVFVLMQPGTSQSFSSGYTVPAGSTGYIKRIFATMGNTTSAFGRIGLWTRGLNSSPRIRRPFYLTSSQDWIETPLAGVQITAGTDVILRVTDVSANNQAISAGYDILIVKN